MLVQADLGTEFWVEILLQNIYIFPVYVGVYQLVFFSIFKNHAMSIQKCLLELLEFIICK